MALEAQMGPTGEGRLWMLHQRFKFNLTFNLILILNSDVIYAQNISMGTNDVLYGYGMDVGAESAYPYHTCDTCDSHT